MTDKRFQIQEGSFDDLLQGTAIAQAEKARAISQALSRAAKTARSKSMRIGGGGFAARTGNKIFRYFVIATFVLTVSIPLATIVPYVAFFMSPQYEAEAQLSVRSAESSGNSLLSGLIGIPGLSSSQELDIIEQFVESRAILPILDREIGLATMFSQPEIDPLSRLPEDAPAEDVLKYWKGRIDVNKDSVTKILTLRVRTFQPEHASQILRVLVTESERIVNELSDRGRRDAIANATRELEASQRKLMEMLDTVRQLRNARGVLDPDQAASTLSTIVNELKKELGDLERDRSLKAAYLSDASPQMRYLDRSIAALGDQIAGLERQLTEQTVGRDSMTDTIREFEKVAIDQKIAQDEYTRSVIGYETARLAAERQDIYVVPFVSPETPQSSTSPARGRLILFALIGCLSCWGSLVGIAVLVRNYVAV